MNVTKDNTSTKKETFVNLTSTKSKDVKKNDSKKSKLKKKILDFEKMSDIDKLNIDLDTLNVKDIERLRESNINKNEKSYSNKVKEYKQLNLTSKERTKIRKKRDNLINKFNYFKDLKDSKNLKKTIKEFNSFYKETYSLNDFTLNSLCSNNTSAQKKLFVKLFLIDIKNKK